MRRRLDRRKQIEGAGRRLQDFDDIANPAATIDVQDRAVVADLGLDEDRRPGRQRHTLRRDDVVGQDAGVMQTTAGCAAIDTRCVVFLADQLDLEVAPIGQREREHAVAWRAEVGHRLEPDVFEQEERADAHDLRPVA